MKKVIFLLCLLCLTGCIGVTSEQTELSVQKIATQLAAPWSIAKDGETFYISERGGTIVKVELNGKTTSEAVHLSQTLSTVPEAGLLGFVLKNDFASSKEAFAYYTYDSNGKPLNRIVTLQYNGSSWQEAAIHLDGVESGQFHHGGRLAISPKGTLIATIGDGANPELAQNPDSLNGKIIELGEDGVFRVVSSGHRNPQGLAWDDEGVLYASEHGQSANDEINRIQQGQNYGWPIIEGKEKEFGMETPILTSGPNQTWAPSGMAFHKGLLYVAALRGEAILVIDPLKQKVIHKWEGYGRVRDIFIKEDFLYFITNNTDGRGNPAEDDDVFYQIKLK